MTEDKKPIEGMRFNKGKVSLNNLSPIAQICEALVFMVGACKYSPNNWKLFKKTEDEAVQEFLDCAQRHIMAIRRGEMIDPETKCPHASHAVWNLNRINDVMYYGMNHLKDGKDLYQQPLKVDLPPVPTRENVKELWGFDHYLDREQKEK